MEDKIASPALPPRNDGFHVFQKPSDFLFRQVLLKITGKRVGVNWILGNFGVNPWKIWDKKPGYGHIAHD